MLQVQHYLICTGRPVAFVGLLLGYAEFRAYRIRADWDLQESLIELERRFWHENVLPGIPPEPDGSESYGRAIAARLAQDRGTEQVATPVQAQRMRALRLATMARKQAEQAERELRQQIQLSMADAAALIGPGFSASYRTHEVRATGWQPLARSLIGGLHPDLAADRLEEVIAAAAAPYTTTSTQRPFKPTWDEEDTDGQDQ
jgi:predicted phage-related endonuclease